MNTKSLTQLYDQLTPFERLPLIVAAGARGDSAEQHRLAAASPLKSYREPDYYPLAKALRETVYFHLSTLLDLAAKFWQWWGLWMTHGLRDAGGKGTKTNRRRRVDAETIREWRAGGIVRYYASRFVAHVDGWKRFCTELHIDPEVQLKFMIGWETITQTDKAARALAFSAEEADRFVRLETVPVEGDESRERAPVPVETVEEVAEGWHKLLDHMVIKEGGAPSGSDERWSKV